MSTSSMRSLVLLLFFFFQLLIANLGAVQALADLGEGCDEDDDCAPGLNCQRIPRKKCLPVDCAVQAATRAFEETNFDLQQYGSDMMDQAGITMRSPMFRPFPDKEHLDVVDTSSSDMAKFLDAVKNNPPPLERIRFHFENCASDSVRRYLAKRKPLVDLKEHEEKEQEGATATDQGEEFRRRLTVPSASPSMSMQPSSQPSSSPSDPRSDFTFYYGASWELGAIATYNGDVFWASNVDDPQQPQIAVLNNCFGFVIGYDAGVGGLLGFAFTDDPVELTMGCKQMFPIFEAGIFALQLGFIDCDDPIFLIELTAGLGAGFSLPGYTSCTTTSLL